MNQFQLVISHICYSSYTKSFKIMKQATLQKVQQNCSALQSVFVNSFYRNNVIRTWHLESWPSLLCYQVSTLLKIIMNCKLWHVIHLVFCNTMTLYYLRQLACACITIVITEAKTLCLWVAGTFFCTSLWCGVTCRKKWMINQTAFHGCCKHTDLG